MRKADGTCSVYVELVVAHFDMVTVEAEPVGNWHQKGNKLHKMRTKGSDSEYKRNSEKETETQAS